MKSLRNVLSICLFFSIPFLQLSAQEKSSFFDLSDKEFDEPVELNGLWDFYWEQLITDSKQSLEKKSVNVPSDWSDPLNGLDIENIGFTTYKTTVKFGQNQVQSLGIYIPHIFSSYKLFINGAVVYESGKVDKEKDTYKANREPKVFSLSNIDTDEIDVMIQVANFDHLNAGLYYPISIGKYNDLFFELNLRQNINLFLAGGFFITGFILLAFALTYKQLEGQIPFYALFSLSMMYRMLGADPYPIHTLISDFPFFLSIHLEYLSIHTATIFGGLFVFSMYPKQTNKYLKNFYLTVSFISLACVIFLGPIVFTYTLKYYLFFVLVFVAIFIYIISRARMDKEITSGYLLFAMIVVMIWTSFQIINFLNFNGIPYYMNVVLVSLIIIACNLALLRTFMLKIQNADQAESDRILNKAKQLMLSLISHEIKTPVATLQMNLEMLNASLSNSGTSSKLEKILKGSNSAIESMKQMVNDFVYFMSRGTGGMSLLNSSQVLEGLRASFDITNISEDDARGAKPKTYNTDLLTLKYIISTLLSNALKYSAESEQKPEITFLEKNDRLIIKVSDYGIGMSDKQVKELGKVNIRLSEKSEVSGVGFHLAQELISQLGHQLVIDSNLGFGTTVMIEIESYD